MYSSDYPSLDDPRASPNQTQISFWTALSFPQQCHNLQVGPGTCAQGMHHPVVGFGSRSHSLKPQFYLLEIKPVLHTQPLFLVALVKGLDWEYNNLEGIEFVIGWHFPS